MRFRAGRWWQERTPDEKEETTGMLVGSLLALMAFLLAVTMGMATERFDARRQDVLLEANAIGTVYLRAGYLPQPASDASRELLREYAPLRIDVPDPDQVVANFERSDQIQNELWAIAEPLTRGDPDLQMPALYYLASLNDMIDLGETRLNAVVYARVPEALILLLFVGATLTLGMVGFHAGLTRRRSLISALVLVIVLGAVITLVVDRDAVDGLGPDEDAVGHVAIGQDGHEGPGAELTQGLRDVRVLRLDAEIGKPGDDDVVAVLHDVDADLLRPEEVHQLAADLGCDRSEQVARDVDAVLLLLITDELHRQVAGHLLAHQ